MIQFIIANWRYIAGAIVAVILAIIIWWYGFHNPAVIKSQQQQIAEVTQQRDNAVQALTLLDKIQKEKGRIDAQTFKNISTIRAAAIPRNSVLIRGGVLQTMP